MQKVNVELPPKLIPIFLGEARYRCAYGGRGSGKTFSFAKMAVIKGMQLSSAGKSGVILCAREFMNSLSDSSMAEVKAAIASEEWLKQYYNVGEQFIRTKDGRIEFIFAGLRHNLDSIKSKAKIHIAWVDEAEPVTEEAWRKLIPTVREEGSEIWVTWNPEREQSATHQRFRVNTPQQTKITQINWRDNPWFPKILEMERQNDFNHRVDHYKHIWEGDFISIIDGTYYVQAEQERRITNVRADPLLPLRAFWDIGGTGAKSDATAIWIAQFVGREIRVLDYYEAQGQALSEHINWLRAKKYDKALMVLPHDGVTKDCVHDVSFQSAFEQAGLETEIVGNQGAGAARMRIEAVRRLFPRIWFNRDSTKGGRDALAW